VSRMHTNARCHSHAKAKKMRPFGKTKGKAEAANTAFPTAIQRIKAAKKNLAAPSPSPIQQGNQKPTLFLLDPEIAKTVLSNHELNPRKSSREGEDDHRHGGNSEVSAVHSHEEDVAYADLHKPAKPTKLLHHALTNANGDVWTRQRHCVSRAFAVEKQARHQCAEFAASTMVALVRASMEEGPNFVSASAAGCSCRPRWRSRSSAELETETGGVEDIRILAREVAIHTMAKMVLGKRYHRAFGCKDDGKDGSVVGYLREMISDSLEPRRDEEFSNATMDIVGRLDDLVRNIIQDIAKEHESSGDENEEGNGDDGAEKRINDEDGCLVRRLLQHEYHPVLGAVHNESDEQRRYPQYYLTRDEVVGNAHSAMLAGTQTICTTIAGAFSHLAEHENIQSNLRLSSDNCNSLKIKDVVMETLRILPPVAGLPRVAKNCDLNMTKLDTTPCGTSEFAYTYKDSRHSGCPIARKNQVMVVDLLAFAHAQPDMRDLDTTSTNSACNDLPTSLKFDPINKLTKSQAQPWGVGRRKCPAGIISVECIGAVIERVLREGITWKFADPIDCVGEGNSTCGGDGWIASISYCPTLKYSRPIRIIFEALE